MRVPRLHRRLTPLLPTGLVCALLTTGGLLGVGGCAIFTEPVSRAAPPGLQWLASLSSSPAAPAPRFDLNLLQSPHKTARIDAGDLLEVTVWDLHEPGRPHVFPVRVTEAGTIDVPPLGEIPVRGGATAEIESRLSDGFREAELLLQPRIVVRELEAQPITVYVTGAVVRPGMVRLPRKEATPFAALVSGGGLARNAGTHILLSHRGPSEPPLVASRLPTLTPGDDSARPLTPAAQPDSPPPAGTKPSQANPTQVVSVLNDAASGAGDVPANAMSPPLTIEADSARRSELVRAASDGAGTDRWFDISREQDRQELAALVLVDGDMIAVKQSAPPVRILGAVRHPGSFPLPAGNALNVWEALQMAGGPSTTGIPMSVSLTRPARDDHNLQRWSITLGAHDQLPANAPFVQPGDIVHIEPTARGRVQRAVGGLGIR